jgi:hypothetical protein
MVFNDLEHDFWPSLSGAEAITVQADTELSSESDLLQPGRWSPIYALQKIP